MIDDEAKVPRLLSITYLIDLEFGSTQIQYFDAVESDEVIVAPIGHNLELQELSER